MINRSDLHRRSNTVRAAVQGTSKKRSGVMEEARSTPAASIYVSCGFVLVHCLNGSIPLHGELPDASVGHRDHSVCAKLPVDEIWTRVCLWLRLGRIRTPSRYAPPAISLRFCLRGSFVPILRIGLPIPKVTILHVHSQAKLNVAGQP
jgi:hypothetical protein